MDFEVVAYLASKGLRGRPASGGREIVYPCFFDCGEPADSKKKKLYVHVADGFYHCKVCGVSGGTYTLQQHFGDEPRQGTSDDTFMRRRILDAAVETGMDMLTSNDDVLLYLLNERGLSAETIVERKIGFVTPGWSLVGSLPEGATTEQVKSSGLVHRDGARSGKDFFFKHLLIPFLSRGHAIQIRGRAWGEVKGGRYMTGPGEPARMYNADSLDGAEEVLICEGEFDCMIVAQTLGSSPEPRLRRIAVVGLSGTHAIPDDFNDLLADVKRVYIGFDSDDAGKKAAESLKERIGNRARILVLPYDDGRKADWTEYLLPAEGSGHWKYDHPYAGHGWRDIHRLLASASGKRIYSIAEAGEAFRAYRQVNSGVKTGYLELDGVLKPGLLPGQVVVLLAKTGCLAGDTEIAVNRAGKGFKIPIAKLLDRWEGKKYAWDHSTPTYVQREQNGVVRLVRLKNAWRSGIKTTYLVTTESGKHIRATDEHPFLTPEGWRNLGELTVGSLVMVNGGRSTVGTVASKKTYSKRTVPGHPFAGRRNVAMGGHSVPYHRLVFEAYLNDWDCAAYIERLRDPDAVLDGIVFLDPSEFAVHHIDHDVNNNDIGNLALMVHRGHSALHAREGNSNAVLEQVVAERIVAIERHGEEETYDLEVEDDPHNFIANGFVVHNSGKTVFLCNLTYNMRKHRVLFLSLEMTREEIYDRLRRIYLFHNPLASDQDVDEGLSNVFVCDENRLGERDLAILISEFYIEAGGLPEVVLIDYLGYYARGARGNSPYEKATNAVMQLKAEAKAGRFVIIVPSQVNRMAKEGKPIDLDDARDSGAVEETADFLLALYRPDDALNTEGVINNVQPSGRVMLSVLKSRHGGKGKVMKLQMDLLTLTVVPDDTPDARRARSHNDMAWQGLTWDALRKRETAPVQRELDVLQHGRAK